MHNDIFNDIKVQNWLYVAFTIIRCYFAISKPVLFYQYRMLAILMLIAHTALSN